MFTHILFWLFVLFTGIQCSYALYFFIRFFALSINETTSHASKPVSVIICARNESGNLQQNLPSILAQRYTNAAGIPLYEVIVVNDASADDSEDILKQMQSHYDNLYVINIPNHAKRVAPGKKYALSQGVEHAHHDWLLFTDADCLPASENWISDMVAPLYGNKKIVAGYGQYKAEPGMLNAFTRWETLHTFLQYSTYTLAGKPYMAVGRNLACTKDIWLGAQQSAVWGILPSGDDDLLMQTMATRTNTAIICTQHAITITESKKSWVEWMKQKQRHMSTGKYYKNEIKMLLGLYALSHAGMWLTFIILLFLCPISLILGIIAIRCFIYWCIWATVADKLKEKKLWFFFPVFDFGWMIYNFVFSPYIIWKNKRPWT